MPTLPPVARLSLAFAAGAALALLPPGRPLPSALFLLPALAALIRPFPRPRSGLLFGLVALAGLLSAADMAGLGRACPSSPLARFDLTGYMEAAPVHGRGAFRAVAGPCGGDVRVVVPDSLA
ncbi:MAG TPA: hypothetical protein VJ997_02380, partial [Longimicrobiales bacterium]|nr:hypothetical protein [Longimicrobiales bacterium]